MLHSAVVIASPEFWAIGKNICAILGEPVSDGVELRNGLNEEHRGTHTYVSPLFRSYLLQETQPPGLTPEEQAMLADFFADPRTHISFGDAPIDGGSAAVRREHFDRVLVHTGLTQVFEGLSS